MIFSHVPAGLECVKLIFRRMQRFGSWIVGVKMSKDSNLIAGNKVQSSKGGDKKYDSSNQMRNILRSLKERARNARSVVS